MSDAILAAAKVKIEADDFGAQELGRAGFGTGTGLLVFLPAEFHMFSCYASLSDSMNVHGNGSPGMVTRRYDYRCPLKKKKNIYR